MEKIIEVSSLKKYYGNIKAVNNISFYVNRGSLFAFLGTNGAGKSTTIDILSTMQKKDSGNVIIDGLILGKDDKKICKTIGIVFQDSLLDSNLTVRENLIFRGKMYDISKIELEKAIDFVSETLEFKDILDRRYGKLSGGQKRRVDIGRAIINTPKILFLDEPTTGLDPSTRKAVWNTIKVLQEKFNTTIFLTTHYMEEAAKADYITIIEKGVIIANGTTSELKEKYAKDLLKIVSKDINNTLDFVKRNQLDYRLDNKIVNISLQNTLDSIPILEKLKANIQNFEVLNGTMDDVFLNITKNEDVLKESEL